MPRRRADSIENNPQHDDESYEKYMQTVANKVNMQ